MSGVLTAEYEGRTHLLPVEAGESVAALRATLAEAVGVPPRELSLRIGGALLRDGTALREYPLLAAPGAAVAASRVTTLRAVVGTAAAILAAQGPWLAFYAAVPAVLWFGLRRRGLPLVFAFSGLRLPFAE